MRMPIIVIDKHHQSGFRPDVSNRLRRGPPPIERRVCNGHNGPSSANQPIQLIQSRQRHCSLSSTLIVEYHSSLVDSCRIVLMNSNTAPSCS